MFRASFALVAVVVMTGGCTLGGANENNADTQDGHASLAELVAQTRSGVIRVESSGCQGIRLGSGFLLDSKTVLTVAHVVDGARHITLKRSGQVVANGQVAAADLDRDLALLTVNTPIQGFNFALTPTRPEVGDEVAAMGFPLGLPLTVTRGAVSGMERNIRIDRSLRRHLVQTDAAVNQGSSGGPLVDVNSRQVVGLVDLGTTEANGIAFAVSATTARSLLNAWQRIKPRAARTRCVRRRVAAAAAIPDNHLGSRGEPGVTTYHDKYFFVDYPTRWRVLVGQRRRGRDVITIITDRRQRDVLLRVEFLLNENQEPMIGARRARRKLSERPDYAELEFTRTNLGGEAAVRWEFLVEEGGVPMHKVVVFLLTAAGDEVSVMTQAPESQYYSWSPVFDGVRNSFVEETR